MHKIKALDYLCRHRLKSELASFEKLIDFWFTVGKPSAFNLFWNEVENLTDYETAQEHYGDISRIIDAWKEVQKIESGITNFVTLLKSLPRRDAAKAITKSYGTTGRTNMAFTLLDSRPLSDEQLKKLLYQALKS